MSVVSDPTPQWVKDAVFYQIFPERFDNGDPSNDPPGSVPWDSAPTRENYLGGDLQGIIDRLPYLADLGVTGLYLTPVFKAGTNHKYDTWDYLQVDPAFGDNELLASLVKTAHRFGIRVVLDAVFNHCGDGFWAFQDVLEKGSASAYVDWFFPAALPLEQEPPTYQTCGGAAYLPKLNLSNPEVQAYFLHVGRFWIETCDIDGWRLDVPWKAPMDFWRSFRAAVKTVKPEAYLVAEAWRDTPYWLAGDTCDATMNYPLRDCILDYCVRDTMDAEDFDFFTHRLRAVQGPAYLNQLNLLGSHDTPRLLTLCAGDERREILAITAQFTLPGAPMVYYGDEAGMLGENDPGCRAGMLWQPPAQNGGLSNAYRNLIQARRRHPALRTGCLEKVLTLNGVYAFRRVSGDDEVLVVINPREELLHLRLPLAHPSVAGIWRDVLTGKQIQGDAQGLSLEPLPAKTAFVFIH